MPVGVTPISFQTTNDPFKRRGHANYAYPGVTSRGLLVVVPIPANWQLSFLGLDPKWVVKEVRRTAEAALDLWPTMLPDLLDDRRAGALAERLKELPLVPEVRSQ